jgi:excisionase family DNA binding protein
MNSKRQPDITGLNNRVSIYIGISEAARLIGVSRSTIYRLIESKVLTVYRPTPSAPRLSTEELLAYVARTAQP